MKSRAGTERWGILDLIVETRRRSIEEARRAVPLSDLIARAADCDETRGFRDAVASRERVSVIGELKKASPSAGVIREEFQPAGLARTFEKNGAAAVSVLTETDFFLGRPEYIGEVREAVGLPILRKDFIIDPYQVWEARVLGADAVLLIARILEPGPLTELLGTARGVGLDCLTEVHDERDLRTALGAGADLIGINNRDLKTFATDLAVSMRLARLVPDGVPVAALSGIRSREDIERLTGGGIYSFLIGETLMRIADTGEMGRTLRTLVGGDGRSAATGGEP
jgi:indole-3-glycerol phosphate synthase